jgi:hypothetical protein
MGEGDTQPAGNVNWFTFPDRAEDYTSVPAMHNDTPDWSSNTAMPVRKIILKGAGIEVDYTIGASESFIALIYRAGAFVRSFTPLEIQTDATGLGQMISVSLLQSPDSGGERFGFFLPFINMTGRHSAAFGTVGIYETFSGPDFLPTRPSAWRMIDLAGTAETGVPAM